MIKRFLCVFIFLLFLSSCTIGPDYAAPELSLAKKFHTSQRTTLDNKNHSPWWQDIKDLTLNEIIKTGLEGNLSLEASKARIIAASARLGIAKSNFLPRANINSKVIAHGISEEGVQAANPFITSRYDIYDLDAQMSWELDLFGRVRRGTESAFASLQAQTLDAYAAEVSLASTIAQEYMLFRAIEERIAITYDKIHTKKRYLQLNKARYEAGISDKTGALDSSSSLADLKSSLRALEFQLAESSYRLDILTGKSPGSLISKLRNARTIAIVPPPMKSGIPSELLKNRPDVLAAENRLISANAAVGVAEAEYLPRFSLVGGVGFAALSSNDLLNSNSRFFTAGPSLSWRLLEFWRIDDEISEAEGRRKEALANYKESVLRAVGEVETSLVRYEKSIEVLSVSRYNVGLHRRNFEINFEKYKRGIITLLSVLDAKNTLDNERDKLVLAKQDALNAYILLSTSLGGHLRNMGPKLSL